MAEARHTRRRFLQGGAGTALGLALGQSGALLGRAAAVPGQGDPRVGELRLFGGDWIPVGWLACTGESISKADHPDLFAAIGDRFGTDGDRVKLPDLRSRAALGSGELPGGATYRVGDRARALAVAESNTHPSTLGLTYLISTTHAPDVITAEVRPFAFGFAPQDWFSCHGQTLSIARYTRLFSIVGTHFGGNGRDSFQLPDLRGYTPVSHGDPPDLDRTELGGARLHLAAGGEARQPRLHVTYCIATAGTYPERKP
jgi:microcystin-dependent protein